MYIVFNVLYAVEAERKMWTVYKFILQRLISVDESLCQWDNDYKEFMEHDNHSQQSIFRENFTSLHALLV